MRERERERERESELPFTINFIKSFDPLSPSVPRLLASLFFSLSNFLPPSLPSLLFHPSFSFFPRTLGTPALFK